MRKKLIFTAFLFSAFAFLSLLIPDSSFAVPEKRCYPAKSYTCHYNMGESVPSPVCCRSSECWFDFGKLNKWEYGYIDQCCFVTSWYWQWKRVECSVSDSCRPGTIYLYPSICLGLRLM